jgi:hypothetical protein
LVNPCCKFGASSSGLALGLDSTWNFRKRKHDPNTEIIENSCVRTYVPTCTFYTKKELWKKLARPPPAPRAAFL